MIIRTTQGNVDLNINRNKLYSHKTYNNLSLPITMILADHVKKQGYLLWFVLIRRFSYEVLGTPFRYNLRNNSNR